MDLALIKSKLFQVILKLEILKILQYNSQSELFFGLNKISKFYRLKNNIFLFF